MTFTEMPSKPHSGAAMEELTDFYWYALDESNPLLLLSEKGRISYANKLFCRFTGLHDHDLSVAFTSLIHASSHYAGFEKEINEQIRSGKTWRRKIFIEGKYGKALCFDVTFYPWPGRPGPVQHLMVLKPQAEASGKKVPSSQESTEELSHIAHDLKNPLYNLAALSGLLLETPLNEQQQDFVKKIKHTSALLSGMIDDMILSCMGQEGSLEPEKKLFALKKNVNDFRLHFGQRAEEKGILASVDADPSLPECVIGDARRLNQIVVHLSGFLLSHPYSRAFRISALPELMHDDKCQVSFFVLGQLNPMGEASEEALAGIEREMEHTLQKVNEILQLLGGQVLLHESNERAFYFHFSLPFEMESTPTELSTEELTLPEETTAAEDMKILVAEDVELNQMVMKHQLKKMNIEADFVRTGFNVLERLRAFSYDLILMDVQMPGLDGLETIKAIRSDKSKLYHDIPIIGITASIGQNARKKCMDAGANDFVPKPYEVKDLENKINKLIVENRKLKKAMNPHNPPLPNLPKEKNLLYNLDYLEEVGDGDKEFSASMISYFIENTPEALHSLKHNAGLQQWEQVRQIAHRMKPQIHYMGIPDIEDMVENIEQYAHEQKNLDVIPDLIEKTSDVCYRAIEQLKVLLKKMEQE